ncbi:unnamed protein product [Linum tenue]|uniref:Uncharacterized protein n=1 Tax=Linum tenue TaxID=586396 RepID=A0AAV0PF49_9ROSI|nr:unnamed protein product [Linum tenue]
MAEAFTLTSDNQFVTPSGTGESLYVYLLKPVLNDVQLFRQGALFLTSITSFKVGPSSEQHKALQVFGVTIEGGRLGELARELRAIEEGNNVYVYVNRLGLCIMLGIKHPSVTAVRINDCFGWSKYGVRVPQELIRASAASWNRLDMFNGETVMDVGGMARAAEEAEELRRSLEGERVELATCRKELEWMKKNESLWSKLVEEKDKKVETLESQLQGFKAALRELVDRRQDGQQLGERETTV